MKKLIISLSMFLLTIGAYSQNSNPQSVTLGKNAGWNNTAPFNIFIGTNSGFNAPPTQSGRIYIGGYDSTSGLYTNLNTGVFKINNIPIVKQSDSSLYSTRTYVNNLALGLIWMQPVDVINLIGDTNSPILSPVIGDAYLIDSLGATGNWSSFKQGFLVQYQGVGYHHGWVRIDSEYANNGDHYIIAGLSSTTPVGQARGKKNYYAHWSGGHTGHLVMTAVAPQNNWAAATINDSAYYHNVAFTYTTSLGKWVQFSGSSNYNIGSGLLLNGLTMYVNPNISLQSPTANTQTRTDSTTKLATTAFVRSFMPLTTVGTGATCGKVTMLSSGSVTVNTTAVQTTSIILITNNSPSGNATTAARVSARVAGTSFTIQSGTADTSVYGWLIINP